MVKQTTPRGQQVRPTQDDVKQALAVLKAGTQAGDPLAAGMLLQYHQQNQIKKTEVNKK